MPQTKTKEEVIDYTCCNCETQERVRRKQYPTDKWIVIQVYTEIDKIYEEKEFCCRECFTEYVTKKKFDIQSDPAFEEWPEK